MDDTTFKMNSEGTTRPLLLSIAAVERDTGLSKDTLRIWERRYGFPQPVRDAAGERAYPLAQVEKLRVVKRLLDVGHRPGQVVVLPLEQLQRLSETVQAARSLAPDPAPSLELNGCLRLLREHDVEGLRRMLGQARARMGVSRLVSDVIAPLNTLVGEAWMRGQLEIYEEHAYTESVQIVLREGIRGVPPATAEAAPRVLLSTLPGEPHGLGLLMAEAVLAVEGASCLSLGVQTPVWDIVLAAKAYRSDVVALSFTGCMTPNHVVDALAELRAKLPAATDIWAGGASPVLHRRPVSGVSAMASLRSIVDQLRQWRGQRDLTRGAD